MTFETKSKLVELMPEHPENFPTGPTVKVLRGRTLTKFGNWFKAIVLVDVNGHKKVRLYGWQKVDGVYKQRQKFTISHGFSENITLILDAYINEIERTDLVN
jgi:hypothetical protein